MTPIRSSHVPAALLAAATLACGPAPSLAPPVPALGGCLVASAAAVSRDTLAVALAGPFQPERIGRPVGEAERTLVRNVYETLVREDCRRAPVPGLAARWFPDESGTRWTFVLRPGARFTDGTPVTARDVAAGWADRAGPRRVDGGSARALVRSFDGADDSTFTVTLGRPVPATIFADPSLAVVRRREAGGWPLGTGPYQVLDPVPAGRGGYTAVRLGRVPSGGPRPRAPSVLEFRVPPGADLRNALDLGMDVVLTRDPGALAYADAIDGVSTTPLVWDRTYVLLAPAATGAAEPPPASALRDLANDAIRTEARPAAPITSDGAACPAQPAAAIPGAGPLVAADTLPRILYLARDEAARGLAERLAALAGPPAAAPWAALRLPVGRPAVAVPLDSAALDRALRSGRDAAYLVRTPTGDTCVRAGLYVRAPWLERAAGAALTPLVDTRARAVLRGAVGVVVVDGDGALRFDPDAGRPPRR